MSEPQRLSVDLGIPGPLPAVLSAAQVAAVLRMSTWKLYRCVRDETLPTGLQPLPIGKPLRWSTSAVLSVLDCQFDRSAHSDSVETGEGHDE